VAGSSKRSNPAEHPIATARLERHLLAGLQSGEALVVTPKAWWAAKRRELLKKMKDLNHGR
jgi:hypothetical protein